MLEEKDFTQRELKKAAKIMHDKPKVQNAMRYKFLIESRARRLFIQNSRANLVKELPGKDNKEDRDRRMNMSIKFYDDGTLRNTELMNSEYNVKPTDKSGD